MITRNHRKWNLERRKQAGKMIVGALRRHVHEIAGDHQVIRAWLEAVDRVDASCERRGGVDVAIREFARRLDVQVGNLRDQDAPAHEAPHGSNRISAGSTARPTRSPALIAIEFGTSTMIALL